MPNHWGIVAEFDSAAAIYRAAEQATAQGYSRVDTHSPFPIHGIDKALRQGPSPLGWLVVCCGVTGIVLAQVMMWWTNAVDYEFWVSGKEPYAWPSTIPITFELMVLLSAFGAVFGMFGLNRLPRLHHPIFNHSQFHRASDDRFFLSIDGADPKFDHGETPVFLESLGGKHVELLEE
jgi:Alternative complex III, ActD subunit